MNQKVLKKMASQKGFDSVHQLVTVETSNDPKKSRGFGFFIKTLGDTRRSMKEEIQNEAKALTKIGSSFRDEARRLAIKKYQKEIERSFLKDKEFRMKHGLFPESALRIGLPSILSKKTSIRLFDLANFEKTILKEALGDQRKQVEVSSILQFLFRNKDELEIGDFEAQINSSLNIDSSSEKSLNPS